MGKICAIAASALLLLPGLARAQQPAGNAGIVQAADDLLAVLSAEQRQKVIYSFDDKLQRARWSNFPTGFVPRGGISLKQMSAPQRDATLKLLATVLSPMGLEKVDAIRAADDDFKANGSRLGPQGHGGPPPGPPPGSLAGPPFPPGDRPPFPPGGRPPLSSDALFGSDLYYVSFLGTPSTTTPWMLQFGGHHLALNITMVGAKGVMTPTLTGAQPAIFKLGGKTIRPLGRESDKALALLHALSDAQRKQAVLNYKVADLVLGPGEDGKTIQPEGLKAVSLTAPQQAMLMDLISEWTGMLNETVAASRMAELDKDIAETWFAWSGAETAPAGDNITAYYRIQGPHLVIEYAPQSDEPGNHVHTMYRDPTDDYGSALTR